MLLPVSDFILLIYLPVELPLLLLHTLPPCCKASQAISFSICWCFGIYSLMNIMLVVMVSVLYSILFHLDFMLVVMG